MYVLLSLYRLDQGAIDMSKSVKPRLRMVSPETKPTYYAEDETGDTVATFFWCGSKKRYVVDFTAICQFDESGLDDIACMLRKLNPECEDGHE